MPELKRLRRRTFPIPAPHNHQRRRLHLLDEVDRRRLRIHRRIVIHRRPEERHHPLVNRVLPVIRLPVRNSRSRHRRPEPGRLRHREHRHKSAVTPARQTLARLVD